jgi:2-hydroxychromene-2-carboxylate isomerase
MKLIDYYFTPISPFAYLGHDRFVDIVRRHGATVAVKPINLGTVFPVSGGLPLSKRAPQRQAYRLVELRRWSQFLRMPMNVQPKYFPVSGDPGGKWIIAALGDGEEAALKLAGAMGRATWVQERNIADEATLAQIAREQGLDAAALASRAANAATAQRYDALTQEAIERSVFGSPTYVYRNELFWGQDRLDFLDRALAQ